VTFSRAHVDAWAEACSAMGNEIADADGFVAVRALLRRFDAKLVLRPLLVEAMLCEAADARDLGSATERWRLLVDSDKYTFTENALTEEGSSAPLPSRFRNTIAHELTHSLAFRAKEFGIDLTLPAARGNQKPSDVVKEVERHTEKLSPLLLAPERALDGWFPHTLERLTPDHLTAARRSMGISRFVLIQRLNLLRSYGDGRMIERRCFRNVAVGVGSWARDGRAVLKGWPLFVRFDNNESPAFASALRRAKSMDASMLTSDPSFVFNGGDAHAIALEVPAGTEKNPESTTLRLELLVENSKRRTGGSFYFAARRVDGT